MAISAGAEKLLELGVRGKNIRFFVDSQSAILALEKFTTKNSLVKQAKQNLNKLGLLNKVLIQWIPGHEGHLENEVEDRLVKRGANEFFGVQNLASDKQTLFLKNLSLFLRFGSNFCFSSYTY